MGAQVTGVDLSNKAIEKAKDLALELNLNATFICCNVLEIDQHLQEKYDMIFTSYGTIGWIPELGKYFKNVAQFLKPGGQFLIADFHPLFWMYNSDFSKIEYSYFNTNVIVDEISGSYASAEAKPKMKEFGWNHPFSEIFTAVIQAGLNITHFNEYNYSPYKIFDNAVEKNGGFMIKGLEGKMPLVYSMMASRT